MDQDNYEFFDDSMQDSHQISNTTDVLNKTTESIKADNNIGESFNKPRKRDTQSVLHDAHAYDKDLCEPCANRGIVQLAIQYCQECDEKFCEVCCASHRTQKVSKTHKLHDVKMAAFINTKKKCEPCFYKKIDRIATSACKDCKEFLCDKCKVQHLSQRQNKSHQIIPITEDLLCEPCYGADKKEFATVYCKDCKDPEPLCLACGEQHKAMKQTRNHSLSNDLASYILLFKANEQFPEESNLKKDDDLTIGFDQWQCEPCDYKGKHIKATHYCKECKEMYCEACVAKHCTNKKNASHEICDLKDILKYMKLCEPCTYNKKEIEATHKCEDCDEHLCDMCAKTHRSKIKNRNHCIKPVADPISCVNCLEQNMEVIATFYCTECEEPLCDVCSEDHKAMKKTRDHLLSTDFTINRIKQGNVKTIEAQAIMEKGAEKADVMHQKLDRLEIQTSKKERKFPACEPCTVNDKDADAYYFCEECEEALCADCMNFHKVQRETENHQIDNIHTDTIYCVTCQHLNKKFEAVSYCVVCPDASPLCAPCAQKHTSMKRTKGHTLSSDLCRLRITWKQRDRQNKSNKDEQESIATIPLQQKTVPNETPKSDLILGKPYATEQKSNCIVLQWKSEYNLSDSEIYIIMYKEIPNGTWKMYAAKDICKQPKITIDSLKADTEYTFKVRIVDDKSGYEGPFTVESDAIKTQKSPALGVLSRAEKIEIGPPSVYRLPIKENISARNEAAKTRKFNLGKESTDTKERTIMIVGATGSGKSTLINGMANYIMGVTWEDPFRFTLINLETCEKEKVHDQAHSQTEWVTCYTLHNTVSDRVEYTVNLIDTPGFGDTRGLEQDAKIVEQIRELFTAKGEKGVLTLDAVCFILKAPDARLTTTQKYIFESILALFGNDIKDNICTLITFADGQRPPVLSGIQALDGIPLPYETYFTFNNSALFVDNTACTQNSLSPFFWDMGIKSCQTFFRHLTTMQTRSLALTSEVLRKRQKLETTVHHLQQEIEVGLSKINVLEKEVELFTTHANVILANKNFEYEVDEDYQEKIDLTGKGQYTTNCLTCNFTCHENCVYSNDEDKKKCCVMNSEGNCGQCPKNCHWKIHHNLPYIIKWSKRKVTKRYDEMKKKYEEATQKTLTQEQVLDEMHQEIIVQEQSIQVMMEIITKLNNRLKEIALRPDPLSTVQYIDLMIASEDREKKSGFEARIDALHKCKQRAQYGESVKIFQDRIQNTRKTMAASDVADMILKDDKSILGKLKSLWPFGKK